MALERYLARLPADAQTAAPCEGERTGLDKVESTGGRNEQCSVGQPLRDSLTLDRVGIGTVSVASLAGMPVRVLNGRMREELLNLEVFDSLFEAKVLIEDWRVEYNDYRPHRSLRMLTPSEYAALWKADNEARLS